MSTLASVPLPFSPPVRAHREVAVVVAAVEARSTVLASLARFVEEADDRGEVILVDASRDGTADEAQRVHPAVRVVRLSPGRLVPQLWSEGLRASDAALVAFSTAQMVPRAGWLNALREQLERSGAAGVGGPIEPADGLSPSDQALYLQRYVNYLTPLSSERPCEPPGDNALYRRSALQGLEAVWREGFWEVEVHRGLRARGETLAMSEGAIVEFAGGSGLAGALRQRRRHARHYGATRAGRMGRVERLARSAAAPMVPAVLIRRIVTTLAERDRAVGPWLPALPALSLLLAAWSLEETTGTWFGPRAEDREVA